MSPYPRLPVPPVRTSGEPVYLYGCRVLAYLIEHDCPYELSNEELELADHAAAGTCGADYSEVVRARVSAVRHLIAATIRRRRGVQAAEVPTVAPPDDPLVGGQLAPLPVVPRVNPPAPEYAKVDNVQF